MRMYMTVARLFRGIVGLAEQYTRLKRKVPQGRSPRARREPGQGEEMKTYLGVKPTKSYE